MLDRHALKALTTAIGRSDGAAFQNLYWDRAPGLYGLALRITGDPAHAAEALQHSFVETWRHLNAGDTCWEAPDLRLLSICHRQSAQIVARHGQTNERGDVRDMADPVGTGTASFELLELIQALGRMTPDSRDALSTVYFDCLSTTGLGEQLSLSKAETTACVRRFYAEFRDAKPARSPVLDREADLLAMRQALGLDMRTSSADSAAIEDWELAFAPFGELIQPVEPPQSVFPAIMDRVNATVSISTVAQSWRRAEILRALLFVGIAIVAGGLVYLALTALGSAASAGPFPK